MQVCPYHIFKWNTITTALGRFLLAYSKNSNNGPSGKQTTSHPTVKTRNMYIDVYLCSEAPCDTRWYNNLSLAGKTTYPDKIASNSNSIFARSARFSLSRSHIL